MFVFWILALGSKHTRFPWGEDVNSTTLGARCHVPVRSLKLQPEGNTSHTPIWCVLEGSPFACLKGELRRKAKQKPPIWGPCLQKRQNPFVGVLPPPPPPPVFEASAQHARDSWQAKFRCVSMAWRASAALTATQGKMASPTGVS